MPMLEIEDFELKGNCQFIKIDIEFCDKEYSKMEIRNFVFRKSEKQVKTKNCV